MPCAAPASHRRILGAATGTPLALRGRTVERHHRRAATARVVLNGHGRSAGIHKGQRLCALTQGGAVPTCVKRARGCVSRALPRLGPTAWSTTPVPFLRVRVRVPPALGARTVGTLVGVSVPDDGCRNSSFR